jgi:hypothetical protein
MGAHRWCGPAVALAMLACVSCTRFESVPLPAIDTEELLGRQIRVTTTDGRTLEFELIAVEDDALVGRRERVTFDEISRVERRDVSAWWTAGAVVGVVAVAGAVGIIVFLVQWMGALNGS